MKKLRTLIQWLAFLLLGLLSACSSEEPTDTPQYTDVTFEFGASPSQVNRAFGGDNNAVEGEFMNSILVFIVDESGNVEAKIDATDEAFVAQLTSAGQGNVTSFTKTLTLRNGRKQIYAFANMENQVAVDGTTDIGNALSAISVGQIWPTTTINGYIVSDPAVKVNIAQKHFIPMSAKRDVYIPVTNGTVKIEMVRLVSKVRATFTNEKSTDINISKFSMSGFADRVPLMPDANPVTGFTAKTISFNSNLDVSGANDKAQTVTLPSASTPEFYVNETYSSTGFGVTIDATDSEGDFTLQGVTVNKTLPRNAIMPLALRASDLQLTMTASVSPIGAMPIAITVNPSLTDNTFTAEIPEGSAFSINGNFGSFGNVTAWQWINPAENTNLIIDSETAIPLTGRIGGRVGIDRTMQFSITAPRNRAGNLRLKTVALDNYAAPARNSHLTPAWDAVVEESELVNMRNQ